MRVLVTGAEGFAGSHLVEHCLSQGDKVWGTCLPRKRIVNLSPLLDQITLRMGDITDPQFVAGILNEVRFDALYHLAAMSFVPKAEQDPARAYQVNLVGGVHVLDAVRRLQPRLRVVLVSSAEVYGHVPPDKMPIQETASIRPANVIGASKAGLEMAASFYLLTHDLQIVIARPFNHTGPRQRTDFVCSSFARQIAEVERGGEKVVRVGDLSPARDFCDVRDVVRAYRLLALEGVVGEAYNLCSGAGASIEHVLDLLVKMARVRVEVRIDPERVRKTQVMDVRGSCEKIVQRCRWTPEVPLEKSLRDLLNWHRDMILTER